MKNETVAVVIAVVMLLAFVAGLGSSTIIPRGSNVSVSTGSSETSTVCTILAGGQVIMQVVNSTNGRPIPSVMVRAEFIAPECQPNPTATTTLSPTVTNGTGFVIFGGEVGDWHITVDGYGYPVEVSTLPERNTCVIISLPSGNTDITYSGFLESGCQSGSSGQSTTALVSTSSSASFTTDFHYWITINYSGSWNLAYWGQNGTTTAQNSEVYCNECYGGIMPYNIYGSLSGSGDSRTEITTDGVGYVQNTLCVDAAILNAATGTLSLTVLGRTDNATAPLNPTVEVCATYGV